MSPEPPERQAGFGVMRWIPAPDNESGWQELLDAAASEEERTELQAIRDRSRRGRELAAQWERDHPIAAWWRRLLIRFASR